MLSVGLFESDKVSRRRAWITATATTTMATAGKIMNGHLKAVEHCEGFMNRCGHHHHSHNHGDHQDIEGFTSVSFQSDGPFSLRKFQNFLDNQMPQEVFRAKGVLWFNESERRHVFHLAGKRFSIDDTDWTGDRKNQLVLDHTTLREQLQPNAGNDLVHVTTESPLLNTQSDHFLLMKSSTKPKRSSAASPDQQRCSRPINAQGCPYAEPITIGIRPQPAAHVREMENKQSQLAQHHGSADPASGQNPSLQPLHR